MSDFDKIDLYGTSYNVKDSTARKSINSINQSITNIENDIELTKADIPVISYDEANSQIQIVKGV